MGVKGGKAGKEWKVMLGRGSVLLHDQKSMSFLDSPYMWGKVWTHDNTLLFLTRLSFYQVKVDLFNLVFTTLLTIPIIMDASMSPFTFPNGSSRSVFMIFLMIHDHVHDFMYNHRNAIGWRQWDQKILLERFWGLYRNIFNNVPNNEYLKFSNTFNACPWNMSRCISSLQKH